MQFLPTLLLTFNAGHAADRYNRKRIVQICQWVEGLAAGFLAWGSIAGWLTVLHIYLASAMFGAATAFERPAGAAMLPNLVSTALLQQGTALSSGAMHIATIGRPACWAGSLCVLPRRALCCARYSGCSADCATACCR